MSNLFPFERNLNSGSPEDAPYSSLDNLDFVKELADGSSVFELLPDEEEAPVAAPQDFNANLATAANESKLSVLAGRLLEEIKQDKESRADWEKTITLVMKYLGFNVEEFISVPFMRASSAFDSTLATALINFYSTARAELFPAAGPVRSQIVGIPTPEIEDSGDRVKLFMNHYLTAIDKEYYSDSERLLMYVGLFGCAFRKVYQDPILLRPIARTIRPQDFIINHHTTSLMSASRMTHVMYLTRKEIILRELSGDFYKTELPDIADDNDDEETIIEKTIKKIEGIDTAGTENKTLFKFYEVHVDLAVKDVEPDAASEEDELPRPYIVTICEANKRVVSVRRNWRENDAKYSRIEYFVHYYYLSGFGIYGLGLAHLMGSNAIALTSILRQLVDAGTLKNFPGGLRKKGLRMENNDKAIGPAEWHEIETGELPIQQCVMLMPYGEPSSVLTQLRQELMQQTANISQTAEAQIPEVGTNTPVGTTLAMLEVANKMQSTILRSLHVSLGREFQLLFDLFGEHLEDTPYPFAVPGSQTAIMKKDFNDKVSIVPVSDPNILTSTHRILRAEALLKLAQSAPELHNIKAVFHRMYSAMNIENIDEILPAEPQPVALDPTSENMMVMQGKPITVAEFQDDEAHLVIHKKYVQEIQMNPQMFNPQAILSLNMHIQQHEASKVMKQIKQQQMMQQQQAQMMAQQQAMMMGQPMPPMPMQPPQPMGMMQPQEMEALLQNPEIQNAVAKMDAEQAIQEQQMMQQQQAEQAAQQIDPNRVMLADIEQHREAAHLKHEDAKLKAEVEAYKAQLKSQSDREKTDAQRDIAASKIEADMVKDDRKHVTEMIPNPVPTHHE